MKRPKFIYTLDKQLIDKRTEQFIQNTFNGRYEFFKDKIYIETGLDYNDLVVFIKINNPQHLLASCNGCGKTKGCC